MLKGFTDEISSHIICMSSIFPSKYVKDNQIHELQYWGNEYKTVSAENHEYKSSSVSQ